VLDSSRISDSSSFHNEKARTRLFQSGLIKKLITAPLSLCNNFCTVMLAAKKEHILSWIPEQLKVGHARHGSDPRRYELLSSISMTKKGRQRLIDHIKTGTIQEVRLSVIPLQAENRNQFQMTVFQPQSTRSAPANVSLTTPSLCTGIGDDSDFEASRVLPGNMLCSPFVAGVS
jgi:hypothetical protein